MARTLIGNVYPSDEYLRERCAPNGYGLGEMSGKSVLWAEIDKAKEFGLWAIWGSDGMKTVNGTSFYYAKMLVLPLDTNAVTQMLFPIADLSGVALIRKCVGDVWQEWEWLDPPMSLGVEYRTTERWNGKPVYTKLLDFGASADGVSIAHKLNPNTIVRYSAVAGSIPLPHFNTVEPEYQITVSVGATNITMACGESRTGLQTYVQLWYTKD